MTTDAHPTDLIPAYALGILSKEENDQVSEHLANCEACRIELDAYEAVVDVLPLAAREVEPAPNLKQALMARVGNGEDSFRLEEPVSWQERIASLWRRPSPILVGAILALVIILALGDVYLWQEVQQSPAIPDNLQVVALMGTAVAPEATGMIVFDLEGHEGTLVADDLTPLGPAQQYQLWLIRDGERVNGGVFTVSESGYGWLEINSETPLQSYSAFGITIEPAGGSPGPTGERVLGSEPGL